MTINLKPLNEQVLVITGASSGIGLVTARRAARRGARVVLAARNEADLRAAVESIQGDGGRAAYVVADVADPAHVERIADTAIREFGRIDTWVNNAAVSVYGRVLEIPIGDMRRQFEVNYWGAVYGTRSALPHLRERGGALVNVASVLADRAVPLQATYCAAKHALKAFTDALRMELEHDGVPVSVTLIKPSSIDTPFFDKARTYLEVEPQPVPPVYAPELVADAILASAERPMRDVVVGGGGRMLVASEAMPRVTDRAMALTMFSAQQTDKPVGRRPDNLYAPVPHDGGERGRNWEGRTRRTSLYTAAALRPGMTATALGMAAGLLAAGVAFGRGRGRQAA